jgi:protein-S-isoprenylcysteine O-methyltransferase Ste14
MKASALEFRLRYVIHAVIYLLGFVAPWNRWLRLDTVRTWQWLASWPARLGWMSFSASTNVVLALGVLFALAAAVLRTWGAAYIGSAVVQDTSMHGDRMVAAGPYRYMRNPLYLGTFLNTLALALLMLPSGALFTIITIGLFQLRLMLAEESFLTARLGEPYRAYCAAVPRVIPSLRARVPESSAQPTWGMGFFSELFVWGVVVSFVAFGWRYNSLLIIQGVVVSLGVSLVARAFVPKPAEAV